MVYIKGPAVDSVCYGNTPSLACSYPNIMDIWLMEGEVLQKVKGQ